MIQDVSLLSKALSQYDVGDTLAKIAGLHLLPRNASHAIRLEALSYAAACNNHTANRPKISFRQLKNLLNQYLGSRCLISLEEDLCENMFTEEFAFYGGSYIVFPGITESPTFILRNLRKALLLSPEPLLEGTPRDRICMLIIGVLELSNEIVRRSGLTTGLESGQDTWNDNLFVPDSKSWALLKDSVTFNEQEFRHVLSNHRISPDTLNPLIIKVGDFSQSQFNYQNSQLMITPVVRVADQLVVAAPGLLLAALLHHISSLAMKFDAALELVRAFRAALWHTLGKSLNLLDNDQIEPPFDMPEINDNFQDGFFSLDTDKILYVQLISDDLRGYDASQPARPWDISDLGKHLKTRHDQIKECILRDHPSPNDMLWLIVFQTMGRPFYFFMDQPISPYDTVMTMSVADLETICQHEDGNPLALWNYAKQKQRIRKKVMVMAFSELDEFQVYQSHHYSYYLSEDALPTLISIYPGSGGELKRQVYKQLKRHGVPAHRRGYMVEVSHLGGYGPDAPIYAPTDIHFSREQAMLLVEQLPIPIWTTGEEYSEEKKRGLCKFYIVLVDLVSYWLWQFSSYLRPVLEPLKGLTDRILIEIQLTPLTDWCELLTDQSTNPNRDYLQNVSFYINAQEATIVLDMKPSIMHQLRRADNLGEREIMAATLVALRNLLTELGIKTDSKLNDSTIKTILETCAPLGYKKKTILLDPRINPILGDQPPSPFRKVQDVDEQQIIDEIGEHLKSLGYLTGPIPLGSRKELINDVIVPFLYKRLQQIIASLRPDNLLDCLINYNEAITWEIYFRRITTPTRLACFSNEQEMGQKLSEEIPEVSKTAMASRFLIEYVAAQPPSGLRPISLEVYDLLLATASLIVDWGLVSDLIEYNIADIQLKILPSGRLIKDKDTFFTAKQRFMRESSIDEIRRTSRSFAAHWQETNVNQNELNNIGSDKADNFAQAFTSEFGLSDKEFGLIGSELYAIGIEQDRITKSRPYKQLIKEIMDGTGLTHNKVAIFIDQLALIPRTNFIERGVDYDKNDIFPWRFNRSLSYLRRPLIRVNTEGDDPMIVWGNSHLYNSMFYLENLCMSGKLKAKSDQMRKFIGTIRKQQGQAFNDNVYDLLHKLTNIIVRGPRIKEFSKVKMRDAKGDIGDIDVLAVDPSGNKIILIECKNLEAARTPWEMDSEIKELFIGSHSDIAKIQKRHSWIENNLSLVLHELSMPSNVQWEITSVIVVSQELMTPYIKSSPIKVLSLRQLTEEFIPGWCKL